MGPENLTEVLEIILQQNQLIFEQNNMISGLVSELSNGNPEIDQLLEASHQYITTKTNEIQDKICAILPQQQKENEDTGFTLQ